MLLLVPSKKDYDDGADNGDDDNVVLHTATTPNLQTTSNNK